MFFMRPSTILILVALTQIDLQLPNQALRLTPKFQPGRLPILASRLTLKSVPGVLIPETETIFNQDTDQAKTTDADQDVKVSHFQVAILVIQRQIRKKVSGLIYPSPYIDKRRHFTTEIPPRGAASRIITAMAAGVTGRDSYSKGFLNHNVMVPSLRISADVIVGLDFQMSVSNDVVTKAVEAAAAAGYSDQDEGLQLSMKSLATLNNMMMMTVKETLTDKMEERITNVQNGIANQMVKDKQDLMTEIDKKNKATQLNNKTELSIALQKIEEGRKKDKDEFDRRLSEINNQIRTGGIEAEQNMKTQTEQMQLQVVDALEKVSVSSSRSGSYASAVSTGGRPPVPMDDPRRRAFHTQVDQARRTSMMLVWNLPVYEGITGDDELNHYLSIFRNTILHKLFGIVERRAEFFMEAIDEGADAFRWRRPEVDRETGLPRKTDDGRDSPTKIYVRFQHLNQKAAFESHKQYLTRESQISVVFYASRYDRQKYKALMEFGKAWKESQKDRSARFQLVYADREDEMYIETKSGKYGGYTRLTDPYPSLFQMSLAMLENLDGDGVNPDAQSKEQLAEENRKLREIKKTFNPVVRSPSAKRKIQDQPVTAYTEKLKKRPKGNSDTRLAANTNESKIDLKLMFDLAKLEDSSHQGTLRARKYNVNRKRLLKSLKEQNVTPRHVPTKTQRDELGQPTAVSVSVPTPVLFVSVSTFLTWVDNKIIDCTDRTHSIMILDQRITSDREGLETEIMIRFKHIQSSVTGVAHVFLTKSKILCQGHGRIGTERMGIWLYDHVIDPLLLRTQATKTQEIELIKSALNDLQIPKTGDGRIKGIDIPTKKSAKKAKMRQLMASSESSSKELSYNIINSSPGLRKIVGGARRDVVDNPDDNDDVFYNDSSQTQGKKKDFRKEMSTTNKKKKSEGKMAITKDKNKAEVTEEAYNLTLSKRPCEPAKRLSETERLVKEIAEARAATPDRDLEVENARIVEQHRREAIESGELSENDDAESRFLPREPEPWSMNERRKLRESPTEDEEIETPSVEPEPTKGERRKTLTTPLIDKIDTTPTGLNPPTKRRKLTTSAEVDNGDFAKEVIDIEDSPPLDKYVSDDYTGTGRLVVVEVPHDLCSRFRSLFETFKNDNENSMGNSEIQVHLCGLRRNEGTVHVITVVEMLIPQQSGSLHECRITDPNFIKNIDPRYHVGNCHVHCDGSGLYLSGIDCHGTAYFTKIVGNPFISGVYDPVKNQFSFMRIKDEKQDPILKCREFSKKTKAPQHAHPDAWATVSVKEIRMKITMVDLRKGSDPDVRQTGAGLIAPFDILPNVRDMQGKKWTPISRKDLLKLHDLDETVGIEVLLKTYQKLNDDDGRPEVMQPGMIHADDWTMEQSIPVEDHYKQKHGMQTKTGILKQRKADTEALRQNPIERTRSQPDLQKLMEDVERLNLSLATVTKANMGLDRELTRMKEQSTIFGGLFESIHDESMVARLIKVIEGTPKSDSHPGTWFTNFLTEVTDNKDKLGEVVEWFLDFLSKLKANDVDNRPTETSLASNRVLHPKSDMLILSWNMNGFNRRSELLLVIDEVKPHICCIQETKLNSSTVSTFVAFFPEYYMSSATSDMNAVIGDIDLMSGTSEGGVTLMWLKSINSKVLQLKVSSYSFVGVILDVGVKTLFLSVYAPCYGKNVEFSNFLDELSTLFQEQEGNYEKIILLGDLNVNVKSSPERLHEFSIWLRANCLVRQDTTSHTHRHYVTKALTNLDCALVSDPSNSEVVNTTLSFQTSSDHLPIMMKLNIANEVRTRKSDADLGSEDYRGNKWKFQPDQKETLNRHVHRQLSWLNDDLPESALEARLVGINEVLISSFNMIMPREMGNNKKKGLWGLAKERRLLTRMKNDRNITSAEKSRMWDEVYTIRATRRDAEASKISTHLYKCPGDIFKFISRLKGRGPGTPDKLIINGEPVFDDEAHKAIISHYNRMGDFRIPEYNEEAGMDKESILRIGRCINIAMNTSAVKDDRFPHVTLQELKGAIFSFPNGKASDLSGCSHEFFKHLDDGNLTLIKKWINSLFDTNQFMSPELSKSRFSLLFKSGDPTLLGNYRRLTVSSVILRIIERILTRRGLAEKMDKDVDQSQWGFRAGRAFEMGLLELNQIVLRHRALNKPLILVSTDIQKCFPRQDGRINLMQMIQTGLSGAELTFMRDTYLARSSFLKADMKIYTKPSIGDNMGETEGGLFSPPKAKLNFDTLAKTVNNSDFGITQEGLAIVQPDNEDGTEDVTDVKLERNRTLIPLTQMADDCAYYENDFIRAAMLIEGVLHESKISRVHFNQAKCWVLAFNVNDEEASEKWKKIQEERGIKIGLTKKLKYLGMMISDSNYDLENVRIKIGKATGAMRVLAGAGLNTSRLGSPRQRIQMVTSFVTSKCLSGLNALVLSGPAESELRKFGDQVTRKIFLLHDSASVHLANLLSGRIRLNALWRINVLSLWLRILALNNRLTEALRFDYYFGIRESWMTQVVSILNHYQIKNFDRLIMTRVVTRDNAKTIHRIMRDFVYNQEFEDMQRAFLSQKGRNLTDFSALRPGKISRHLEGPRTLQECRGINMVVQTLSNGYLTGFLTDKTAKCPACSNSLDTIFHTWRCERAHKVKRLKLDLLDSLPENHQAKKMDVDSDLFIEWCLDPENSSLESFQLSPRPKNYERILMLTRLIAYYSHVNRSQAANPRLPKQTVFPKKRTRDI